MRRFLHFIGHFFIYRILSPFPKTQFRVGAAYRVTKARFLKIWQGNEKEESGIPYSRWLSKKNLNDSEKANLLRLSRFWSTRPKISIVMPVYNIERLWIEAAVQSVTNQIYENWELCMVDDASTNADTLKFLKSLEHPKINIRFQSHNRGIAVASNIAISMATGEYIAFLDHDDELQCNALFEVVKAVNELAPDMIYTDEDKISQWGEHRFPFFKPDWSPDLLRCQNYICHLTVIRKSIIDAVGGFNEGFDGAQDYDLILRVSEYTNRIHHIPKILYSWREIKSSTAVNPASKPAAALAGVAAVDEHVRRVFSNKAKATDSPYLYVQDARFPLEPKPKVSIIIPTKDGLEYLKNCVHSIIEKSDYSNYELIILNNNSTEEQTFLWFQDISRKKNNIKILNADYPFCWSRLNNHGIREAGGEVFIFLNNDTQVISTDWIERLSEQALREDVGVVGPQLLYEDGTIQHAGVIVGMGGWADHVFKAMPANHSMCPFVSPMVKRNVLAVTGSCMAISRKTIDQIGNFDESFMVCGSDVEICLRAYQNGLNNIYDPFVKLFHYESKTRIPDDIPSCDFEMSKKHYKLYWDKGDPFYNVNLSLDDTTPMLKVV
jgi:O-antigen biosynthesis protein